jgi:hypothetical protein
MKKRNHRHFKSRLLRQAASFNPILAFFVTVAVAAIGTWALHNSLAITATGTINVAVYSVSYGTGQIDTGRVSPISSASVNIKAITANSGCPNSVNTNVTALSGTNGSVAFTCVADPAKTTSSNNKYVVAAIQKSGYKLYSGSPSQFNQTINLFAGSTVSLKFYMEWTDADGDGTYDLQDKCPSQSGPSTNGGCPVPAPAPITSSRPPAPPPTPKPSSSSKVAPPPAPAIIATTGSDKTPPSSPSGFSASPSSNSVDLRWDAGTDTSTTGYVLEHSVDQSNWDVLNDNITETVYSDTSLNPEQEYYYRLRAKDASGNQSEATFADAKTLSAETNKPTSGNNTKKNSGGRLLKILIPILLIVLTVGGWLWWLTWRKSRLEAYDDQIREETVHHAEAMVRPDVAEHTSESLKDIVLDDMQNPDSKLKK